MTRHCRECQIRLNGSPERKPGRKPSKYCSTKCRRKYHARRASRGTIIYDLVLKMRDDREPGSFGDLCHQAGLFLAQDKKDGRKSHLTYKNEPIPYQFPADDPAKHRPQKSGR